jgi:hypothetical protein
MRLTTPPLLIPNLPLQLALIYRLPKMALRTMKLRPVRQGVGARSRSPHVFVHLPLQFLLIDSITMSHKRPPTPPSDDDRFSIPHSPYVENWADHMEEVEEERTSGACAESPAPQDRSRDRPDLVVMISPRSQSQIDAATDMEALRCLLCRRVFSCSRKLRVHCAAHYTALFCSCGFSTHQKMTLLKHRKDRGCQGGAQVCPDRLAEFIQQFRPSTIPEEVPLRPVVRPQLRSVVVSVPRVDQAPPRIDPPTTRSTYPRAATNVPAVDRERSRSRENSDVSRNRHPERQRPLQDYRIPRMADRLGPRVAEPENWRRQQEELVRLRAMLSEALEQVNRCIGTKKE